MNPLDALIIPAGGTAERFGEDKLTRTLGELPVFAHAIRTMAPFFAPERRFIAVSPYRMDEFKQWFQNLPEDCQATPVPAGNTRFQSVCNAFQCLPADTDIVAIHDAVRPIVPKHAIQECLEQARKHGCALLAHPVTDTIKIADGNSMTVSSTPPRNTLWAAETPQAAQYNLLKQAYKFCKEHALEPTDDAQATEAIGIHPVIVPNSHPNIKITYPVDYNIVQALLDTSSLSHNN